MNNNIFIANRMIFGFTYRRWICPVLSWPEKNLFLLPKEMDKRYGVFIEPLSVALHVVRNSGFKVGQKALIFGAGAIGILIGMWLKIFGARQITIVDLRKESLEIAFKSGFNEVVNPQDKHFQKYQDYDVCFEAAGSGLALLSALEKAKRCGGVTVVGRDTKDINIPHNIFESFMRKEISIYGCWGYNNTGENEFIYQMLKENRFNFEPLITHTIALSEGEKTIKQMFNKEIFFFAKQFCHLKNVV